VREETQFQSSVNSADQPLRYGKRRRARVEAGFRQQKGLYQSGDDRELIFSFPEVAAQVNIDAAGRENNVYIVLHLFVQHEYPAFVIFFYR
jgi:hypothetical protein